MVAAPLAVWAGLKLPQVFAGVQLQSAPALVLSFVTVAVSCAVALTAKLAGAPLMATVICCAGALTVIVAVAMAVAEAVALAVMVTLPAAVGAVKVVEAPLAVCAGLKLPQEFAGAQLQSTPALVLSLATVAVSVAVAPVVKVCGAPVIVMVIVGGGGGGVELEPPPQPAAKSNADTHPNTLILLNMRQLLYLSFESVHEWLRGHPDDRRWVLDAG